ncbi:MAG: glycosyltransferase [Marinicaulis sp.]|nr:glycosyltransferase [Marinicaulis sp.]
MTVDKPLVVGLLPAWNAEAFLQETLHSISAQTYPNYKILASIDKSTDRTAEILKEHAANDDRYTIIEQSERLGWVGNINALLEAGEGDYFHFAFHDDILLPAFVETCVSALKARPNAILAYTDMTLTEQNGEVFDFVYPAQAPGVSAAARASRLISMKNAWATPNRGVFSTEAARATGGMRKHRAGEFVADWTWLINLSLQGEFAYAPETLVQKRIMKDSLSKTWDWSMWKFFSACEDAAKIVNASDLSLADKTQLHAAIAKRFAKTALAKTARRFIPALRR